MTEHMSSYPMSFTDAKDFVDRARARSTVAGGARILSLDDVRAQATGGAPRWQLDDLIGRLVEISGLGNGASFTAVTAVMLEAQCRNEPVAWIGLPGSSFFPPDLDDSGIDLAALVVVRVRDSITAARAADTLLRSGGFGLVVLDLAAHAALPMAAQGRLVGLAQRHDAALIAITTKPRDAPSLGSIVSLRVEAIRARLGAGFQLTMHALKDKRRGPGWRQPIEVIAPAGMK